MGASSDISSNRPARQVNRSQARRARRLPLIAPLVSRGEAAALSSARSLSSLGSGGMVVLVVHCRHAQGYAALVHDRGPPSLPGWGSHRGSSRHAPATDSSSRPRACFVAAACDRLIPADRTGPGALARRCAPLHPTRNSRAPGAAAHRLAVAADPGNGPALPPAGTARLPPIRSAYRHHAGPIVPLHHGGDPSRVGTPLARASPHCRRRRRMSICGRCSPAARWVGRPRRRRFSTWCSR